MEADADLDNLLDDALDGFKDSAKKAERASERADAGGTASSSEIAGAGLAFDPFADAGKKKKKDKGKEPSGAPGKKNSRPRPPEDEDEQSLRGLQDELQTLMAALGLPAEFGDGDDAAVPSLQETLSALNEQTRSATGADADAQGEDDVDIDAEAYAEVLKQLEALGKDGDIAGILERMMGQLLSKDVLYEPLKEISQRYPSWLAERGPGLPQEDLKRFQEQSRLVTELVGVYENSPEDAGRVMELMQKMQACGTPPQEILKELSPGLDFAEDGSPIFPAVGEHSGAGGEGKISPEFAQQCAQM